MLARHFRTTLMPFEPHLRDAAMELGYNAELWPNWSDHGLYPGNWHSLHDSQKRAATTLGLSAEQWPPPQFNQSIWRARRPKYVAVASGDEFRVGQQARVARGQALDSFKRDPSIDLLIMDGVATSWFRSQLCGLYYLYGGYPASGRRGTKLISRAYRMGADVARPIKVITLAYEDSLEEHIVPDFASEILPTASRVMGKSIARGLLETRMSAPHGRNACAIGARGRAEASCAPTTVAGLTVSAPRLERLHSQRHDYCS